jgi:hypothetical protein
MNYGGKDYKRVYVKVIGIRKEHFDLIEKIRGKKSKAGKLDEIIEFYKKNKKMK